MPQENMKYFVRFVRTLCCFGLFNKKNPKITRPSSILSGLSLCFESAIALFSTPITNLLLCEFYQLQAISPTASRENQPYSAVICLQVTTHNDSPVLSFENMRDLGNYFKLFSTIQMCLKITIVT